MHSIVMRVDILFFVPFISIHYYFLHLIIYPQSSIKVIYNTMSHLNTIWPGVACNVVCYILCTAKSVAASIPDQW